MKHISVSDISVELDGHRVVDNVLFDIKEGEFVGLVGPNGSGKSSLLRTICRVLKPKQGMIAHLGDDIWKLSAKEAARRTAVVAQERIGDFDFTVEELVAMGRSPHKKSLQADTAEDHAIIVEALRNVGMGNHLRRQFMSLSGGEKQRVLVARALAQQTRFLVLDEPTNHLDIRHQLELLELVRRINTTTLAALHDLSLAARYCDRLIMLHQGRVVASGPPETVLTEERIAQVYGVNAEIVSTSGNMTINFSLAQSEN
jgi:iron complex transport system ATP-binding protein